MPDVLIRIAVVCAVIIIALAVSRLSRPWQDSAHPPLRIPPGDLPAGVVLFTSTDCDQCGAARAALKKAGIEYREVTWELEAGRFEAYGVQAVPLLACINDRGEQSLLAAGIPTRRSLRAVHR